MTTTAASVIISPHILITPYRRKFTGSDWSSFVDVFSGTTVVTSTVATTDATTTESTSDAGIVVVASAE